MPILSQFELDTNNALVALTDGAATLTAAQTIDAIVTMTPTASRALTTPTGAEIVAAFGGTPSVGATFELTIVNVAAATHPIVLTAAATGVTLGGVAGMATVAAATSATFVGRIASLTSVVFYRKGG
jgi:hypothetical protein